MDATPRADRPLHSFTDDQLLRLQLRVARRADELARSSPSGGSARRDRETWRRAEGEFLPALSIGTFAREANGRSATATL